VSQIGTRKKLHQVRKWKDEPKRSKLTLDNQRILDRHEKINERITLRSEGGNLKGPWDAVTKRRGKV